MTKPKYTLDDCKKMAENKDGRCLAEKCTGTKQIMQWECKNGHIWETALSTIISGHWCKKCYWGSKKGYTIQNCIDYAKTLKGNCLSNTYINNKELMEWQCEFGHSWLAALGNIKRGRWCPYCSETIKHILQECIDFAISKNGKCNSTEYINANTKMLWECNECDFEWTARFSDIKNGQTWCPKCATNKTRLNIQECKKWAENKGGKCKSDTYINSQQKLLWECVNKHEWWAKYSDIKHNESWCPDCDESYLQAQNEIDGFIKSIGISTISNTREIIPPLELDIYSPEKLIAVEYCGLHWHGEKLNGDKARNKHLRKLQLCKEKKIRLVTIFEDEWLYKKEQVKGYLRAIFGKTEIKIGARKCEIKQVNNEEANNFHKANHIQGKTKGKHIGLYYDEQLVCLASFTKTLSSRIKNKEIAELIRYTIKIGYSVRGGLGKLLKYFAQSNQDIKSIVSFSDNRWSNGGIYEALNFEPIRTNEPSYWYFRNKNEREHKSKYQKSGLKKLFPECDIENNTEWKIMQNAGYDRIWDCGNIKWMLKLK